MRVKEKRKVFECENLDDCLDLYFEDIKKLDVKGSSMEELLTHNINEVGREGVTAEQLNKYLGERGVAYIAAIMNDLALNKDFISMAALARVIEHLVVMLVKKEEE